MLYIKILLSGRLCILRGETRLALLRFAVSTKPNLLQWTARAVFSWLASSSRPQHWILLHNVVCNDIKWLYPVCWQCPWDALHITHISADLWIKLHSTGCYQRKEVYFSSKSWSMPFERNFDFKVWSTIFSAKGYLN